MINIDKEIIKENFSKGSISYDSYSRIQAECADYLLNLLEADICEDILEIGCGTGAYTLKLRDNFSDSDIIAIDLSKDMINIAKKKKMKQVEYLEGDAEKLELTGNFDLITSNACMQWFGDFDGFVKRLINKNIKQSGTFCFSMYGPETYVELKKVLKEVYGQDINISSDEFLGVAEIKAVLEKYFDDIVFQEKKFELNFDSFLDLLKSIKFSGTKGKGFDGKVFLGAEHFKKIQEIYIKLYGEIKATHQVMFFKAKGL